MILTFMNIYDRRTDEKIARAGGRARADMYAHKATTKMGGLGAHPGRFRCSKNHAWHSRRATLPSPLRRLRRFGHATPTVALRRADDARGAGD